MGIASKGFLAGASGQALDFMKSRQDDERELRKTKMLQELRRDTAVFLADYKEKLDEGKVDKDLSGFDSSTGEYVSRDNRGREVGRRADPGMAQDLDYKRKMQGLQLDAQRANIDQSRASAEASRASAARSRTGGRGGLDGSGFDTDDRLATVNKIENNLKDYGYNQRELSIARQKMLEGVQKGWSLDQFVAFEETYLEDSENRGRIGQLSNAKVQEDIFGKPKRSE
jgi:hypothetical protein